ncbi:MULTISPECIES: hypothetical protein [unclassified Clostridium]|uniref:hypothetical protein n=1 Tax=unclassified Clostridium TaxID=2614128 RepID=UPI0002985294|nr:MULTISPECIES: hypothetical protein [unclassified Clostridium]EKQ57343.1 MAG: hypothetical protein A370_00994 [Clostridium sp. Maddingley MBC34-26]
MKKLIILCLNFCLCVSILTGCGISKEVKKLTDEDIKTFSSQMNADPLSGDITLNGIKYTLPVKAKSLEDNGWKYNDYADKGKPLKDNYYIDSILMDDGSKSEESRITVTIYNTSGSEMKFEDAMIGGIKIDKANDSYKNTVVLPKGVTLASTYEDIIKAYGAPTFDSMKQTGLVTYISHGNIANYGQKLEFQFDKDKNVIKSIYLKSIPENK